MIKNLTTISVMLLNIFAEPVSGDNSKTADLKKAIHYLENELLHTHEPDGSGGTLPCSLLPTAWQRPPEWSESFDR